LVRGLEVPVVGNLPASDPPDPFDWIEFGRIGWQEDARQAVLVLDEELLQLLGLVPTGVVQDNVQLAVSAFEEITEKVAEGLGIEGGSLLGEEAPPFQVECPEVTDLLTGRSGQHTRLLSFGRPHSYQAAVSLEVYFVLAPKLNVGVLHPLVEVFLKASCWRGSDSRAWRRGLCRVKPSLWNNL